MRSHLNNGKGEEARVLFGDIRYHDEPQSCKLENVVAIVDGDDLVSRDPPIISNISSDRRVGVLFS